MGLSMISFEALNIPVRNYMPFNWDNHNRMDRFGGVNSGSYCANEFVFSRVLAAQQNTRRSKRDHVFSYSVGYY